MHHPGFIAALAMWMGMMTVMMAPGVVPAARLHATLYAGIPGRLISATGLFMGGYTVTWFGYSIAGASLQITLQRSGLLNIDGRLGSVAAGMLLAVAGAFQFTRFKDYCLTRCRNPMSLFLTNWHDGPASPFALGLRHGLFCVGCCWALMALGFAVGLMNLIWMGIITLIITAEKLLPSGRLIGRVSGVGLILWGITLL